MKIRVSVSVKQFKNKAEKFWKLKEWEGISDPDKDLLFFGLYHDRDFEVFHNFKGDRSVFWCGGDILRVLQDYERRRILKINPAKHYCENEQEAQNLRSAGVEPEIIPSFLGDIESYQISFKVPEDGIWKVWMCGHPNRENEYGFGEAKKLARMFDVEFHFYGVDQKYPGKILLESDFLPNVFYHGLVPEAQLDEEIKNYHCGLRCNEQDGLSEVVVKSILLGQYPISRIPYEGVWSYQTFPELVDLIVELKKQTQPNTQRELWIKKLNNFPFIK